MNIDLNKFVYAVGAIFAVLAALKGVTEFMPQLMPVTVKAGPKAYELAVTGAALILAARK
jgi:uncharacterized membrane protein